jgi:hypothetical protein
MQAIYPIEQKALLISLNSSFTEVQNISIFL